MQGSVILIVFFVILTAASLLIPSPMFPGNVLSALIGEPLGEYTRITSALFNGLIYGIVLWLAFVALSRRLSQEK